jgi:hypothetical protein
MATPLVPPPPPPPRRLNASATDLRYPTMNMPLRLPPTFVVDRHVDI